MLFIITGFYRPGPGCRVYQEWLAGDIQER